MWGYGAKRRRATAACSSTTRPRSRSRPCGTGRSGSSGSTSSWTRSGNYLPHLLPVDPTLHWANPPGGTAGRDTRPDFSGEPTPGPYTGPVPIVTHVHGAVGVADDSDGYAEAWYLPAANNIPAGYATEGTWYDFFAGKAAGGLRRRLGTRLRHLPVPEREPRLDDLVPRSRARHDAAQRLRRPGRLLPHPRRAGRRRRGARQPNRADRRRFPAPRRGRTTSSRPTSPTARSRSRSRIARSTRTGRSSTPTRASSSTGSSRDYIPEGEFSPIWNPEFFGNTIMVNGNTWPFLTVEQRRYRLRFLNGCQSRFLILDFGQIPGVEVVADRERGRIPRRARQHHRRSRQPAADGPGRTGGRDRRLHERAGRELRPRQRRARRAVRRRRSPASTSPSPIPTSTGQIMQFRVVPAVGVDDSTPPQFLQLPAITPLPAETVTRPLALIEKAGEGVERGRKKRSRARRGAARHGRGRASPDASGCGWTPVTENPAVGATEVWEFYNTTADAHPMHVHEVDLRGREPRGPRPRRRGRGRRADPARRRRHARPSRGNRASRTPSSPIRARSRA